MNRSRILLMFLVFVFSSLSFAQVVRRDQLRILIDPRISSSDSAFIYRYKIQNHLSSEQRLEALRIEVGDYYLENGGSIGNFFDPRDWYGWFSDVVSSPVDLSARGTVVWISEDSLSNVSGLMVPARSSLGPGDTVTLTFESNGLPSIKRFWASGWARPLLERQYDSLLALGFSANDIQRPWYEDAYKGLTISPQLPSAIFQPLNLLDTLLSYTRQSAQLGWLGRNRDDDCDDDERPDDGVVRNIENRLQKARRELVRGDSVKARRELEKLIRKVDRLQRRGERVMTSEAYALLKYNTEYLIERLPERRRR